ncbi:hypothetical protein [Pseudomonas sp. dw_358]|uniref:hypothetical protein n=1 Tax=Pseudomonas sp. dw_358 TaxID=2720083 RepID=UPI001BD51B1A|nr:hypothetical protein [Pseudomonas sp. dw_358]
MPTHEFSLCGRHVFAFGEKVAAQDRDDLLLSNLLAQLVSDKKQIACSESWRADYLQNLGKLGWVMTEVHNQQAVFDPGQPVELMHLLSAQLLKIVSSPELDTGRALLEVISEPSSFTQAVEAKILLPDVGSAEPTAMEIINRVSLTLIMVTDTKSLHAVNLVFETLEHPASPIVRHSFQPHQLRSDIRVHHSVVSLSNRYSALRAGVIAKLGEKADELIVPWH